MPRKRQKVKKQDALVPVVTVLLLGLEGSGAYGYILDGNTLEKYLSDVFGCVCPHILETGIQLCKDYDLIYDVIHVLGGIEVVQQKMKDSFVPAPVREIQVDMGTQQWHFPVYDVEATKVEDTLSEVVAWVMDGGGSYNSLYKEKVVVVINPDKWQMRPQALSNLQKRIETKDFLQQLDSGMLGMEDLLREEAGYSYRWNYKDMGRGSTWISSSNFVVIDLNSGPVLYGPESGPEGSVLPVVRVPRIHDLLHQSKGQATQLWETRLNGLLGTVIGYAVQHVFVPVIQFENLQRVLDGTKDEQIEHNILTPEPNGQYPQIMGKLFNSMRGMQGLESCYVDDQMDGLDGMDGMDWQEDETEQKRQQEQARPAQMQQQQQAYKSVAQRKLNFPSQRSTSQQRRQAECATTEKPQRQFFKPELNPHPIFDSPSGPMTEAEQFAVFLEKQDAMRM